MRFQQKHATVERRLLQAHTRGIVCMSRRECRMQMREPSQLCAHRHLRRRVDQCHQFHIVRQQRARRHQRRRRRLIIRHPRLKHKHLTRNSHGLRKQREEKRLFHDVFEDIRHAAGAVDQDLQAVRLTVRKNRNLIEQILTKLVERKFLEIQAPCRRDSRPCMLLRGLATIKLTRHMRGCRAILLRQIRKTLVDERCKRGRFAPTALFQIRCQRHRVTINERIR